MGSVIRSIGRGILYFFAFPFGLIAIALYAVFGLFVFIFQFFRFIFLFFTGRSFKSDLPEDIEAKKILEQNKPKEESEEKPKDDSLSLYPNDVFTYSGGYISPAEEKPKVEEEKIESVEEEGGDDNE